MRVHVVDPALFTLPYDIHFCRALADAGAEVVLVGRGLRRYERVGLQPFEFRPLFYRRSEDVSKDWRTSTSRKILKGIEHIVGLRALAHLATIEQPNIVHLQWFVLPMVDRHFLRRIGRHAGLVLTVHDSQTFHGSSNSSWLQRMGDRAARLHFDHYIVHTEQTWAGLRRLGISDARISTIPHPPLSLPGAIRSAEQASAGPVRILFFGSIKHYKGVDVLVEAGLSLASAGVDFVIDIVGRPFEAVEGLQAKIAAAGKSHHFRFDLRYIPDEVLADYLQAADLVVFPYRKIDASGALALAIEVEKPIVASDIGVFAEEPARQRLHLVKPGDVGDLARALLGLIEEPALREQLWRQTRQLKVGMQTWPGFAQDCLTIYRRLIGRSASG